MKHQKYRAWDKLEKKWLFGYGDTDLGGFSLLGEVVLCGMLPSIPLERLNDIEITEFVGKKDSKGRDIYDGDIYFEEIEHDHGDERLYFVCRWVNHWSRFVWLSYGETLQKEETLEDDGTFNLDIDKMHYAGNIFENQEVLR
jgi:uncharacterized phage protein (TIGR01671 family)